ncbi:MAG: exosortase A [Nitrospirota bacterium]
MKVIKRQRVSFQHILSGAVILFLFVGLYYPVILKLISQWSEDPNYSHGFIVPLISGYLIWKKRGILKDTDLAPSTWGILVLIGGLVLFVLGNLAAELFTMRTSMLVVLAGLIISVYGLTLFRYLLFPYCYLYFMIPLPYLLYDSIAFPLKLFVAKYSVLTLQSCNISVYREGNIIMLPHITLEVAEACSGIRSLISLLVLGVAFAHFSQKTRVNKAILVISTLPIAVFTNAIRVVGTGFLANFFGEGAAEGFFHEFAGLTIFVISMFLLITVSTILNKIS